MMNKTMKAADIIAEGKLDVRRPISDTRSSVFSRWLRHNDEGNNAFLLNDEELDNIKKWLTDEHNAISNPELIITLLPKCISFYVQRWLTPHVTPNLTFENTYAIYRSSASIPGRIVVGRLYVTCEGHSISAIEHYDLTDGGPKGGRYESEGGFVQSTEGDVYLLSRFSNGDLQTAVFTNANVYKSGHGENKVIRMSGVIISTMAKKPYVARIHCEADSACKIEMRTLAIDEVPRDVQETPRYPVDKSELNVVRF